MFRKRIVTLLVFACLLPQISVDAKRHSKDPHKRRLVEIRRQIQAGKAQHVVYELESITSNNPQDAEAWILLSKAYTDLDFSGSMMPKAIAAAQRAVDAAPNNSTCLKSLAELYARKGRFKEALALLHKAMEQKVVDPFVYKSCALILSETKRDKEAVIYWDKFVEVNPKANTNINHMDGGALIYARAGQTDKAADLYDKMYEMEPSDRWISKKAEAYSLVGRNKDAIAVYSKMISRQPDDEISLIARARLYSKLGKNKEALADMNAAIKEVPTASMFLERAKIYDRLGNAAMAKRDRVSAQSADKSLKL